MLYVLKIEEREYMRDLAMAQIAIDKDTGVKKFEDYRKLMFPWIETSKKRQDKDIKDMLERETQRGPMSVRSMGPQTVRSRLKKVQPSKPMTPADRKSQEELFSRLAFNNRKK